MLRVLALSLIVAFGFGCKKDEKKAPPPKQEAPITAGTVDGEVRKVDVMASLNGYNPERIAAKPGEKLTLVFTRTVEGECLSQLRTPDGKVIDLPMNEPVEVPVTVPETGELTFACGMDMFKGTIIAQSGS
jgi:plastocyanin domain-containing protein